jgi:hypothetical protein
MPLYPPQITWTYLESKPASAVRCWRFESFELIPYREHGVLQLKVINVERCIVKSLFIVRIIRTRTQHGSNSECWCSTWPCVPSNKACRGELRRTFREPNLISSYNMFVIPWELKLVLQHLLPPPLRLWPLASVSEHRLATNLASFIRTGSSASARNFMTIGWGTRLQWFNFQY